MKQIVDLIKMIGAANGELKINIDDDVEYVNPIQIEDTENKTIEDVEDFTDYFAWVDDIEEEEDNDFEPSPAYKHDLEMELLYCRVISRGECTAKRKDINYNEDPWERQMRLERSFNKFLSRN